eukprot:6293399-Alexandrium_andersonii.AAC.1
MLFHAAFIGECGTWQMSDGSRAQEHTSHCHIDADAILFLQVPVPVADLLFLPDNIDRWHDLL